MLAANKPQSDFLAGHYISFLSCHEDHISDHLLEMEKGFKDPGFGFWKNQVDR